MLTTWKFRIKDSGSISKKLSKAARSVNWVWNFCKETQITALKRCEYRKKVDQKTGESVMIPNFLSAYELNTLSSGSGKLLGLHSQSVQAVCEEYVTRRKQFKKLLRWRGKKALGWVPFKASGIQLKDGVLIYCKQEFSFWQSRNLPQDAVMKVGSFTQDTQGHWYASITFESELLAQEYQARRLPHSPELGVDLGVKTLATLSNEEKIERPNLRQDSLKELRRLERTRRWKRKQQAKVKRFSSSLPKQKRLKKLHAKISNQRRDYLHKKSTWLVNRVSTLVVGNLRCALMNRSKTMSGISLDSGIGMFRQMLRFKAMRAGVAYIEVSERDSTQTCSSCGWKPMRESRIGLGVREWECPQCRDHHDRDINAATNILRMGRHTLTRSVELPNAG